jgi:hypothetical protein
VKNRIISLSFKNDFFKQNLKKFSHRHGVGGGEGRVLPGDLPERPKRFGLDRRPDHDLIQQEDGPGERDGRQPEKPEQRAPDCQDRGAVDEQRGEQQHLRQQEELRPWPDEDHEAADCGLHNHSRGC